MTSVSGFIIFVCIGIVLFGTGYLYWFKADEYFDRLASGMGGRQYYKSPAFIWSMRLGITVFMFVYIYVLVNALIIKQP